MNNINDVPALRKYKQQFSGLLTQPLHVADTVNLMMHVEGEFVRCITAD